VTGGAPRAATPVLRSAGVGRKLGALLYEGLILTALIFFVGFIASPLVSGAPSRSHSLELPSTFGRVTLFLIVFAALAAYCVAFWSNGRRTLPQKTWRLRIVDETGAAVSRRRALARYLACWIGPVLALALALVLRPLGLAAYAAWLVAFNFLWLLIDRDRQFLHDRIVGTRIVAD
jgi:uncharacterized RDD family membrane protein YckC